MPNTDMTHVNESENSATKHPRTLAELFRKVSQSSSINRKNSFVRLSKRDIMRQKRKW